jgi:hypothetical protein
VQIPDLHDQGAFFAASCDRCRRSSELKLTASKMRGEVVPLTVEQDASQVEHPLGTTSAPTHPRAIETHSDEVADRTFDDAGGDVEIVAPKGVVAHAMAMLADVREDIEQLLAPGLVAGTGLRDGGVGRRQRGGDLVGAAPATQFANSVADPCGEFVGALAVQTSSSRPQLFDDVDPVDARLGLGEPGRLLIPDRFGAIGEEQRALGSVAALDRLVVEPLEQRGVALEGRVEPLVDRAFARAVVGAAQRVDRTDERDLGVLRLVTLGGRGRCRSRRRIRRRRRAVPDRFTRGRCRSRNSARSMWGAPPPSTWMTRISPSSSGAAAPSRNGRASAPTASTMRSVERWLGDHSQNCAKVVRALANASCAHSRVTDNTVDKLNPPHRPSTRSIG